MNGNVQATTTAGKQIASGGNPFFGKAMGPEEKIRGNGNETERFASMMRSAIGVCTPEKRMEQVKEFAAAIRCCDVAGYRGAAEAMGQVGADVARPKPMRVNENICRGKEEFSESGEKAWNYMTALVKQRKTEIVESAFAEAAKYVKMADRGASFEIECFRAAVREVVRVSKELEVAGAETRVVDEIRKPISYAFARQAGSGDWTPSQQEIYNVANEAVVSMF